ncbi:BING4CT-domain-containing protein [Myriangium duriaei CBS 260.36]|uniref:U three protein 7 n=1 Tax=Myriangium duriaei CBS 260.36 TaxID=1168546 RepID=A0A9P4MLK9_9PEZI|nr:BING4CT-domain-containing protein [Myriangium duriaei CBS 260.36]
MDADSPQPRIPASDQPRTRRNIDKPDAEARRKKQRLAIAQREYGRGKAISTKRIKDKKLRGDLRALEQRYQEATLKAKDAEILHENESGYLEAEGDLERTYKVRQDEIKTNVGVETAKKGFELRLDALGPYRADYSRNGRHLLLAGRKGHVATMDWRDGKLGCELQLGETVRDAKWLHNEQYFAVAQARHVYIYDAAGIELHHLTDHVDIAHMEFLPYHFLLATLGNSGYLKYQDTSTGKLVAQMPTKLGSPTAFAQNPYNAILHVGHQNGTVGLWSPNSQTPLVKMLCHRGPVRSMAMDRSGTYMVTTGQDLKMSVWDIRSYKSVHTYSLFRPGSALAISDRNLTAVGWGTQASVWKDLFRRHSDDQEKVQSPYMGFPGAGSAVENLNWCPFEDILGIGHAQGFTSAIVPGAGEPNFDALEVNPYENVKQRQEAEVRGLLNKLQPEMIQLDPNAIARLDDASQAQRERERNLDRDERKEENAKLEKLRNRGRGKNSSLRRALRKKGGRNVIDEKRVRLEEMRKDQQTKEREKRDGKKAELGAALGRFAGKSG